MDKKETKTIQLNENTTVSRNDRNLLVTEVKGDFVLMNTVNGDYWGFNKTTSDLWRFIEEPLTLKDITDKFLDKYDISEENCIKEIKPIIWKMIRNKIVTIDNTNSNSVKE